MGATSSVFAQGRQLYNPIVLPANQEVTDTLSEKDIPTGQGGFARDYVVMLNAGDNVVIDVSSDSFDAILTLISANDGSTVSENDDGPSGSTSALIFTRINKTGKYIVRIRAFGQTGVGSFKLKLTKLRPVSIRAGARVRSEE